MKFIVTSESGKLRFRSQDPDCENVGERTVRWTFDTLEELMEFAQRAWSKYHCGLELEWCEDNVHYLTVLNAHEDERNFFHD